MANVLYDFLLGAPHYAPCRRRLLVPTGDNVREPQNRRVEIVIQ